MGKNSDRLNTSNDNNIKNKDNPFAQKKETAYSGKNIRVSAETHQLVKYMALFENQDMKDLMEKMIKEYKDKNHPNI